MRHRLWLLALAAVLLAGPATAQTAWKPLEHFDFAHRTLTRTQLRPMSVLDLKYLRGLVFGRHGRRFDEAVIQDFLHSRPWYRPNPAYLVAGLNPTERANMDLIKEAEWKRHSHVEPGDLRFYQHQRLTSQKLGTHSALEWQIMGAEIEAWHGRRFPDQPWLQDYFAERYWYRPRAAYRLGELAPAERANLQTIQKAQRSGRRLALAPGNMALFAESPISAPMLHGLSLYELRLLRNEIFARHGVRFRTDWLQAYFDGQPWYQPRLALGNPVVLSAVEKKNAALISQAESGLHQQLSEKPLPPALLQGLSADDARKLRNEIYARRGKTFQDPWLRGYFESQPWYKPDPKFREARLTPTERANAAAIRAYEERGRTKLKQTAA